MRHLGTEAALRICANEFRASVEATGRFGFLLSDGPAIKGSRTAVLQSALRIPVLPEGMATLTAADEC